MIILNHLQLILKVYACLLFDLLFVLSWDEDALVDINLKRHWDLTKHNHSTNGVATFVNSL